MGPLKVSCNNNIVHAGGGIWKHQSAVWWRRLCEGGGHAAAADSHVRGNRRCSARDSCVQDLLKGKSGSLMMHCVLWHQEELQKRIVEEQQNNNLSVEILNGNTESLTGLVGNAQALKEPGIDHSACQHYGSVCVAAKYKRSRHSGVHIHTEQPRGKCYVLSFVFSRHRRSPERVKIVTCLSTLRADATPTPSSGCTVVDSLCVAFKRQRVAHRLAVTQLI